MMIVSKCLAGHACRYDGKANTDERIVKLVQKGEAICVCPEVLGGLPTPREPSEIVGGDGQDVLSGKAKVMSRDGRDVTEYFVLGAQKTLEIAKANGAREAILKSKSPSCGCTCIYDGSFSGTIRPGDGVTAALLRQNDIAVRTE